MRNLTLLQTEDEKYTMSAEMINDKYENVSLTVETSEGDEDIWDNDEWILSELYPTNLYDDYSEEIKSIIPLEDFGKILDLFFKAEKLGFFNYLR